MTLALVLLVASLAQAGQAAAPVMPRVTIELKSSARVAGDWVLVRDVAVVSAEAPARIDEIGALRLGRTPMAGVERVLSAQELANRMLKLGVTEEIVLTGTVTAVSVSAAVRTIRGEELVRFGHAALEKRIKWPAEQVHIEDPASARSVTVPDSGAEMRAEIGARRLAGLVSVAVEVWTSGKRVTRILIPYRVSVRVQVPHMVHSMQTGQVISAGDLEDRERDLAMLPEDAVLSRSEAEGLRTVRPLAEGAFIRRGEVAAPTVLKRGAQVTLVAKIGTVEAKAMATSKEDGAAGQVITVVNTSSKRAVKARVIDSETVEAELQ